MNDIIAINLPRSSGLNRTRDNGSDGWSVVLVQAQQSTESAQDAARFNNLSCSQRRTALVDSHVEQSPSRRAQQISNVFRAAQHGAPLLALQGQ